jgi:acyl-CoA synthetase (AMP-forming)/AMP-acid ligase II
MFTINDLVRRAVLVNKSGYAIRTEEWDMTWGEFHNRIQKIAGALVAGGLKNGDRVAVLSLNNPLYYQFMFGVIWAGGIVVPINTRFAPKEVEACLNELDGVWLCCDENFCGMIEEIEANISDVKGHFFVGKGEAPANYTDLDTLLQGDASLVTSDPATTDVAMIYFTGGTTGKSKGVMLTHQQLKHAAQQIAGGFRTSNPLGEGDCYLHSAPMFHMADGIMCFVAPMVTCANAFMEKFDVARLVELSNKVKVSWITMVPTMVKAVCDYIEQSQQTIPELKSNPIPSLKAIMYGGSPIPKAVLSQVMNTFPKLQLFHGYGATEALIITLLEPKYHTLDEQNIPLLKSTGKPFRGVLLGIFNPDGKQLPPGEIGEVYVRSNSVMKGYWRNPKLTAEALANNWYHTGDAGYLNEAGFLFLVDRIKDMIISGGENIYSAEVENAVSTHPAVDEVAAIGLPDPKWTEIVHVVIKCKPGKSVSGDDIKTHCREWIAGYKVPKSVEVVDASLPKTPVGKIDKVALRKTRLSA